MKCFYKREIKEEITEIVYTLHTLQSQPIFSLALWGIDFMQANQTNAYDRIFTFPSITQMVRLEGTPVGHLVQPPRHMLSSQSTRHRLHPGGR